MDVPQIQKILSRNADKNMVKRIINPQNYEPLHNNDGSYSSHSMAYANNDDGYYVYPTVVPNGKAPVESIRGLGNDRQPIAGPMQMSSPLERLGGREAYERAMQTKNYIQFNNEQDADSFSRNYKKIWMR